jgi:hypothetical protein
MVAVPTTAAGGEAEASTRRTGIPADSISTPVPSLPHPHTFSSFTETTTSPARTPIACAIEPTATASTTVLPRRPLASDSPNSEWPLGSGDSILSSHSASSTRSPKAFISVRGPSSAAAAGGASAAGGATRTGGALVVRCVLAVRGGPAADGAPAVRGVPAVEAPAVGAVRRELAASPATVCPMPGMSGMLARRPSIIFSAMSVTITRAVSGSVRSLLRTPAALKICFHSSGRLRNSKPFWGVQPTCVTCVTFVGALIVDLGCEENMLLHAMGREETDLVRTSSDVGTTGATGCSGPMERIPMEVGLGDTGSGVPPKPAWRTTVVMGFTGCSSGWEDAQPIFQVLSRPSCVWGRDSMDPRAPLRPEA